jgi:small subunit ribosomal protein S16
MPAKIRLSRHGKKHHAYYHIVVADSRAPRDGKFIEILGNYNPHTNPATINLDNDKALSWLNKGAQPTDTCRAILSYKGILYKNHLNRGVTKGLLTQEAANEKFQSWADGKQSKIDEKTQRVGHASTKQMAARLEAETKKKEAMAEAIRVKNTPPPEEATAAEEAPATEEGAAPAVENNEGASEAPAAE